MKKLAIIAAAAATTLSLTAQTKINSLGINVINEFKQAVAISPMSVGGESQRIDVLVQLADDADASVLAKYGANVAWVLDNIAGVNVALDSIEAMLNDPAVLFAEYSPEMKPLLDFARADANVDEVQTGFDHNGTTVSFTGKGVVTGLMDVGVDPNHINFTDADGNTRVKAFYHFTGTNGTYTEYSAESGKSISNATTDTKNEAHGTHVTGIMAGSYNGEGKYGVITTATGNRGSSKTGNIPYYGVATGSDIVMAAGSLTNNNIIGAVKAVVNNAEKAGEPCVVNLSLGSNNGPHDGTDLFSTAMTALSDKAVIVVAAGNEGDQALYLTKEFTADDKILKTFVNDASTEGNVDIWGADATPFKVTVALYSTDGGTLTDVCLVDDAGQTSNSSSSALFKTHYSGSISMSSSVNNLNQRYNVSINLAASQTKAGQRIAIIIEGEAGVSFDAYGTDITFTNNSVSGFTKGAFDGTVNNMACADGVICVGAYTTRSSWPTTAGAVLSYADESFVPGEISAFSSWGKKFGGDWLPHVCAPGAAIISSYNTYYVSNTGASSSMTATAANGTKTNYWGSMQGTSMATPFVSGVIALWLEANPDLTSAEVLEVINSTSVMPEEDDSGTGLFPGFDDGSTSSDDDTNRWGAGKIDALAGIKKVLSDKDAGVGSIVADDIKNLVVTPVDGGYEVFLAGEYGINATLTDMSGRTVANASTANGNSVVISTSDLAHGIYILTVNAANQRHSLKLKL